MSYAIEGDLFDSEYSSSLVDVKSLIHCEFDSGQSQVCLVRGNLAKCHREWEKIGASTFILSVIRDGYKIPFIEFPPPKVSPNNGSALRERKSLFLRLFPIFLVTNVWRFSIIHLL